MSTDASPLRVLLDQDAITSDAIASGCRNGEATYLKRDFVIRPGHWRGQLVSPLVARPWLVYRRTVVIGHSDFSLNGPHQVLLAAMGARRVFAINTTPRLRNVHSMPLGLTNTTRESPLHEILGNQQHFASAYEISEEPSSYVGSVYANFTDSNNQRERRALRQLISDVPGFALELPTMTDKGRVSYLAKLRSSNFTLCPEGNGIDTHRLWETLYMGGIPIIKSNPAIDSLVSDLPVVIVQSWIDVLNQEYLEERWHSIQRNSWDFSKLRTSYWLDQINSSSRTS